MPTDPQPSDHDSDAPAFPDLTGSRPMGADPLRTERVLWTAQFAPITARALTLQWFIGAGSTILMLGIIPIILAPCVGVVVVITVLALAWVVLFTLAKMYVESLKCILTTRSVRAGGGVFFKWERSIPLDKITDVTMSQGPIARMFDVEHLAVETAGGSSGPGQSAAIPLFGVVNPRKFRRMVLEQRDRVVGSAEGMRAAPSLPPPAHAPSGAERHGMTDRPIADLHAVLAEIRDELRAFRTQR